MPTSLKPATPSPSEPSARSAPATVSLDVSHMKDGDYAGLAALQKKYGFVAVNESRGREVHRHGQRRVRRGGGTRECPADPGHVHLRAGMRLQGSGRQGPLLLQPRRQDLDGHRQAAPDGLHPAALHGLPLRPVQLRDQTPAASSTSTISASAAPGKASRKSHLRREAAHGLDSLENPVSLKKISLALEKNPRVLSPFYAFNFENALSSRSSAQAKSHQILQVPETSHDETPIVPRRSQHHPPSRFSPSQTPLSLAFLTRYGSS